MTKYFFIGILIVTFCGCGKGISVTGEVLYEDQPAKDVAVLFESKSDDKVVAAPGVAVTDSSGRFALHTVGKSRNRKIEPGRYTLYLGWKDPDAVEAGDIPSGSGESVAKKSPYRFPESLHRGEIIVTVASGQKNHFVFNITPNDIQW